MCARSGNIVTTGHVLQPTKSRELERSVRGVIRGVFLTEEHNLLRDPPALEEPLKSFRVAVLLLVHMLKRFVRGLGERL